MNTQRYSARGWSAALAVWSGLAVLSILQTALYLQQRGQPIDWRPLAVTRFVDWYTCFAFAPAYVWLIDRFAFDHKHRVRAVAIIVAATVVFVPIKYAVLVPLLRWLQPTWHATLRSALAANVFTEMLFLGSIALAIYALELYRRVRHAQIDRARLDRELAEARLDALALQIQPHFLFNTLNSILALIAHDPRGAEDMMTDLSELLQRTLEGDGHEVTLDRELEHLRLYLAIMGRRFGNRLSCRMELDADAVRGLVPKLLLQPIVENAIEHGLVARGGAGRVVIAARVRGARLEIGVTDDGPGVDAGGATDGIGLSNTRRRLEQMYGSDGVLTVDSNGRGTTVTIAIPYRPAT
jgi:LytS/YehU family sensor histidine kinase